MNLQDVQKNLKTAYEKATKDLECIIQEKMDSLNAQYPKRFFRFGNGMGMQSINVVNAINGKSLFDFTHWDNHMSMTRNSVDSQRETLIEGNILQAGELFSFLSEIVEMIEDSSYNINPSETRKFDMVSDRVTLVKDGNGFKIKKYYENS